MTDLDREVCVCFHVPLGKLVKFHRLRHLRVPSDFARCQGAGTGCGWCVPHLQKLFEQLQNGEEPALAMTFEEYKRRRLEYHATKKPDLPPPPDADGALDIDIDEVIDQIPDDMKLD